MVGVVVEVVVEVGALVVTVPTVGRACAGRHTEVRGAPHCGA
jgi:hypothetical protein